MDYNTAKIRSKVLRKTRNFFHLNDYLEVDPPHLSEEYLPESHIEVFPARFSHPYRGNRQMYLLPSPEYWMKILLSMGYGNIFSISHVFRNAESISKVHNPEFSLLEWYTMNKNYIDSLELTEEYFSYLSDNLPKDMTPPFRRMTMEQAWFETSGVDLAEMENTGALSEACSIRKIPTSEKDDWETLFFKFFISEVEPKMPSDRPLALMDYPSKLSCTALKRENVYERWELYVRRTEICNCFTENSDLSDFSDFLDSESRLILDAGRTGSANSNYVSRHLNNFPACSGNALGLDRFIMLLCGLSAIEGVIFFPFSDTF